MNAVLEFLNWQDMPLEGIVLLVPLLVLKVYVAVATMTRREKEHVQQNQERGS